MDEIFERVRTMLAEQLEIDEDRITMDSNIMEDFDADSLDVVDMVMSLEDEFGIEVPDEEVEKLHTVGDVVRFIDANTCCGFSDGKRPVRPPAQPVQGAFFVKGRGFGPG